MDIRKAYDNAAAVYNLAAGKDSKGVLNERPDIRFCTGSGDFWYAKDIMTAEGGDAVEYTRFIYETGEQRPLFDHAALAALLAPRWVDKCEAGKLPITPHECDDKNGVFYFTLNESRREFALALATGTLELCAFPLHHENEVTSPDKKHSVFARGYNLYCRCNTTGKETAVTKDGDAEHEYGRAWSGVSAGLLRKPRPGMNRPSIVWSPDSRHFVFFRNDSSGLERLPLYQSLPLDGTERPKGVTYPYALPGDDNVLSVKLFIASADAYEPRPVMLGGAQMTLLMSSLFEPESKKIMWSADAACAYFLTFDRFFKQARFVALDTASAEARVLISEDYETFTFIDWYGAAGQESFSESMIRLLDDKKEIIWHSENDNWSSLYVYDAQTGQKLRRLTGDYCVRRIRYFDEKARELYFTAGGRESGLDPYIQQLYKVNIDTCGLTRISDDHYEHNTVFHPEGLYYVDTFSTINEPPVAQVKNTDGTVRAQLVRADISRMQKAGFVSPEPFEALARDGKTKIYGVIYKPPGFDPAKKYPVVHYVYGGAQKIVVPKAFQFAGAMPGDPNDGLQALAQLGFVGIELDGLATPLREKSIHEYVYKKHEEACGLEDHVCAIRQLGEKYSWLDLERVGIYGYSGGGYATARAMFQFPDFFKVGVSMCGDHDQTVYNAQWGERWCGEYSKENYHGQNNANFAKNLRGKLYIIHGDLDDNVHPSASIRLAAALIEANRDFDFLLYPNADHGLRAFPYITRVRWDYFVRHLLGETPPDDFTLVSEEKKEPARA